MSETGAELPNQEPSTEFNPYPTYDSEKTILAAHIDSLKYEDFQAAKADLNDRLSKTSPEDVVATRKLKNAIAGLGKLNAIFARDFSNSGFVDNAIKEMADSGLVAALDARDYFKNNPNLAGETTIVPDFSDLVSITQRVSEKVFPEDHQRKMQEYDYLHIGSEADELPKAA